MSSADDGLLPADDGLLASDHGLLASDDGLLAPGRVDSAVEAATDRKSVV